MNNLPVILKRGYLFDKKVGLLPVTVDRKRWYILRLDSTPSIRVVLEFYKDEKAAFKGDAPKGFINIRDVVTVRRVVERKQSFEILCPGVGYKLMANSDLEADEWTDAIRSHICYTRDSISNGVKSLSLSRVQGSSSHGHLTPPLHERQRALSDSHHATHVHPSPGFHQHLLLQPRSVPVVASSHPHRSSETHTMVQLRSHSFPTPPDSLSSPPSFPGFHGIQRQRSLEVPPALPSPSTSSDSSSLCSGSNTSFEGGGPVFEADSSETKSVFRVQMKETEKLNVAGPVDLVVGEDGLRLLSISPDPRELVFWPLGSLRRYGVNNHCFTIITGRFCATGEGCFQFYTEESRVIRAKTHSYATQKAAAGKGRSIPRRASEPSELCGQSPPIDLTKSLPPHLLSTSPPIYTQSNDPSQDYSRLHHFLAPGNVPTHHSAGGVYTHAMSQPVPIGQQKVPSQHYIMHYSPKNTQASAPHPHMSNHSPHTKSHSYTVTGLDSIPHLSSQFQSGELRNQSPSDAIKSISSGSSLGSGGESVGGASSGAASSRVDSAAGGTKSPEILYPISDEEDETSSRDVGGVVPTDVASIDS